LADSTAGGRFCLAIYNDQGWKSRFWRGVKFAHNVLPRPLRPVYAVAVGLSFHLVNIAKYTAMLKPRAAIGPLLDYGARNRGMSLWRDMFDWIGGYPYEVASFDQLEEFIVARGFRLIKGRRETSLGCHQMVFARCGPS
jgi:2-polyprenyl-6-hydroxyphenyl methylase/3-demethylubiquinone-9 3-methyltransferase